MVRGVGLGDVNGVVLNFTEGVPGDTATATKEGNTYTVTGVASGVDPAGTQVSKPFQIVAIVPDRQVDSSRCRSWRPRADKFRRCPADRSPAP